MTWGKVPRTGPGFKWANWGPVRITHANNTLSAYCTSAIHLLTSFSVIGLFMSSGNINQFSPSLHFHHMSLVRGRLYSWFQGQTYQDFGSDPFAPQFPAHTGMTHGWFSKMGRVLFYLDSSSQILVLQLAQADCPPRPVCLCLTGEFKAWRQEISTCSLENLSLQTCNVIRNVCQVFSWRTFTLSGEDMFDCYCFCGLFVWVVLL